MIRSMTGFGNVTATIGGRKYAVEVRSLNSKSLDANLRLSARFRELEPDIRQLLNDSIDRGKVDLYLTGENETDFSDYKVNRPLAMHYLKQISEMAAEVKLELTPEVLSSLLRLPDVVTQSVTELSEEERKGIMHLIRKALEKLDDFRIQEGMVLEKDFRQRINRIAAMIALIEPFEAQRIEDIRQRLYSDLAQIEQRVQIDKNRFEQEIIYYLEKIEFTEEKLRLAKHCNDFLQTMSEETSQGRKLGFIAQEIGREINTLGSKAYNADIQKIVVDMKTELEKVKEQLLNIL